MFCKSCGASINPGESFCPVCGTPVTVEQQPAGNTYNAGYTPSYTPVTDSSILVFGILSLALGSIFGIIFGAIAKSKANAYMAQGGVLEGPAKVGFILGKVGFILGIITTILSFIIGIVYGVALSYWMYDYGYYYY